MPEPHPGDGVTRMTPANRARRQYAAERYLTRLMAGEPALTDDQLAALRALLIPRRGSA